MVLSSEQRSKSKVVFVIWKCPVSSIRFTIWKERKDAAENFSSITLQQKKTHLNKKTKQNKKDPSTVTTQQLQKPITLTTTKKKQVYLYGIHTLCLADKQVPLENNWHKPFHKEEKERNTYRS